MGEFVGFVRRRVKIVAVLIAAVALYLIPAHIISPLSRRVNAAAARFCSYFSSSVPDEETETISIEHFKAALAKAELENAALKRSLKALCAIRKSRKIEYPLLLAKVVLHTDSSPVRRSIVLDVGSEDGVKIGMPVLWGRPDEGAILVGVVKQVYRKGCRAALVGDIFVRVPVVISPSGAQALLASDGETLYLKYLEDKRVRNGDAVLTSSFTGAFPEGVLVGYVSVTTDKAQERRYSVKTPLNPEGLGNLFVVLMEAKEK
ncbi:MAG: rod shape-determining protein MreC [Planctomycetota bacterium]|nr:rod shape-determining protein MreC [Planctomycetota bacterium]